MTKNLRRGEEKVSKGKEERKETEQGKGGRKPRKRWEKREQEQGWREERRGKRRDGTRDSTLSAEV